MNSWQTKRPIFERLPYLNYRDNDLAEWLTRYWDNLLTQTRTTVDEVVSRQSDPMLCDVEWLDFLRVLAGFSDGYWDSNWTETQKRRLIAEAYTFIWPFRGTMRVLEYLLYDVFALTGYIYQARNFLADLNTADSFLGGSNLVYFLTVDKKYARSGREFKLAQMINRNFSPAVAVTQVVYTHFYTDFSTAGEPVLD